MKFSPSNTAHCLLLLIILLTTCTTIFGQGDEVKISHTAREVRPGLYECVIYLEMSADQAERIDDVTYSLPNGFEKRKYKGKKIRKGIQGYFSSEPITIAEEIVIDIKIDHKGADDVYRSYKLKPR